MKLKKRLVSLLLAVAMLMCIIPSVDMTASAAVSSYEIVSYARQYIGCKYKHGATGPNAFDCSGFVHYVFKHFGIDLPTGAANYFNNPTKYGTVVGKGSVANAQMGDIIAWSGHVAIYTEDGYCVEALGTKYGVLEKYKVDRHKSNGMNYKVIRIKGVVTVGTPKISSVSAENSGVQVKWSKAANAEKYRVFRKNSDGAWKKLADTAATSYVDTSAKTGSKYVYTVRSISKNGNSYTSDYDTVGKSITYLPVPEIKNVSDTASGIEIKWNKVSGAAKYRVFCKTGSGSWTRLADTASTSYVWKGAKSVTDYVFTVRCISSDGNTYTSGYDSKGKKVSNFLTPKLTSVSVDNSGTTIKWDKVNGAEKYRVFCKTANGKWTKIADTTATSYLWTSAKPGTKYTFTVRCVSKDGKNYTSDYDTAGKSITVSEAPSLSSVTNAATGIKLSWEKTGGAEKYRAFYKTDSTGWTKIADTGSTSYTWTGADSGTKYTFTVRCVSSDGKSYASAFDKAGISATYIAAPTLISISSDDKGTTIKWNKVEGAENYKVLRRSEDGSWEKLADTTADSYTDMPARSGLNYYYTVRCVSEDGKSYISGYNSAGIMAVAEPKITSVSKGAEGVNISWGKVKGAEKYRVFRKTGNESWVGVGNTDSLSFVDKTAKSGTTYTYTVRCISKDEKSFTSLFDKTGKTITYIAAPKISSVNNTENGIQLKWGKVAGAEKYRVFYKASGESTWHIAGDTTSASYTWKGGKKGTKYSFTVRCISKDGNTYTSSYDSKGKSITR